MYTHTPLYVEIIINKLQVLHGNLSYRIMQMRQPIMSSEAINNKTSVDFLFTHISFRKVLQISFLKAKQDIFPHFRLLWELSCYDSSWNSSRAGDQALLLQRTNKQLHRK